jgi:hypothetical protein
MFSNVLECSRMFSNVSSLSCSNTDQICLNVKYQSK